MYFFHLQAWRDAVSSKKRVAIPVRKPKWRPPPEDVYKINCDAAYSPCSRKSGWGFVIRNHLGNAVAAGSGSADFLMSAQHAEAIACMKGLDRVCIYARDGKGHSGN